MLLSSPADDPPPSPPPAIGRRLFFLAYPVAAWHLACAISWRDSRDPVALSGLFFTLEVFHIAAHLSCLAERRRLRGGGRRWKVSAECRCPRKSLRRLLRTVQAVVAPRKLQFVSFIPQRSLIEGMCISTKGERASELAREARSSRSERVKSVKGRQQRGGRGRTDSPMAMRCSKKRAQTLQEFAYTE